MVRDGMHKERATHPSAWAPHSFLDFCRAGCNQMYAREHGKGNEYNQRVLQAFFVESQDISSIDVLTKLAGEIGLDEKEFEEALRTRKYREAHQRALRHAYQEAGVSGVARSVIGEQVLTGLQDRATLEAVIEEPLAGTELPRRAGLIYRLGYLSLAGPDDAAGSSRPFRAASNAQATTPRNISSPPRTTLRVSGSWSNKIAAPTPHNDDVEAIGPLRPAPIRCIAK
jgi:hypothetical protein